MDENKENGAALPNIAAEAQEKAPDQSEQKKASQKIYLIVAILVLVAAVIVIVVVFTRRKKDKEDNFISSKAQGNNNNMDKCLQADLTCHANAKCTNTDSGFRCICADGLVGDGISCDDINECLLTGVKTCPANALCANTVGSFTCACDTGFTGDGSTCADLSLCEACDDTCEIRYLKPNVAQGKTATSFDLLSNLQFNLVDGNEKTRYSSEVAPNPWFQIDLGSPYCIHSVRVFRESLPLDERKVSITVGTPQPNQEAAVRSTCFQEKTTPTLNETYICNNPVIGSLVNLTVLSEFAQLSIFEVYISAWLTP